jgi:hypothetical protein
VCVDPYAKRIQYRTLLGYFSIALFSKAFSSYDPAACWVLKLWGPRHFWSGAFWAGSIG